MKVVFVSLISICQCSLKILCMVCIKKKSQRVSPAIFYFSFFVHKENLKKILTNFYYYCYLGYYTKDKENGKLDVVIVEATAITESGEIVPGASVGATPELIQMADKVIIEVNTRIPSFEGLHDITMGVNPPHRKPYLVMNTQDRIGTVSLFIIISFFFGGWGNGDLGFFPCLILDFMARFLFFFIADL